jgi:hypothetical protein
VRLSNEVDNDWATVVGGAWAGPVHFLVDGEEYAGAWRLVDVDEAERRAGLHGQARQVRGWGGVTVTLEARPTEAGSRIALVGEALLAGDARPEATEELARALELHLDLAEAPASPADDPAWRRKLALRAALAVGAGIAAGLAGAAWDKRRRA